MPIYVIKNLTSIIIHMKQRLLATLVFLCTFFVQQNTKAQTLGPGDIAFIGYDFGTTDGFSFIALKPLPAGETIYFTEQGWTTTGWANNTETHLQWVIPSTVPCGTIISIVETSADNFTVTGTSGVSIALNANFNLSGGDQILEFDHPARSLFPVFMVTTTVPTMIPLLPGM